MTSIAIKEYTAVDGSRFTDKDAQKIGPVLQALSENGSVTARDVVDAARSANSPLHEYFEWNDKKAADLYRVEEARRMLRSITVRYIEDGQPKAARAFQVVAKGAYEGEPRAYKSFDVLYGDSAFAASMMDRAFDDLVTWKNRYQPYVEMWVRFGDCFQAVLNQISEFEEEVGIHNIANGTDNALSKLIAWREDCRDILESWIAAREQIKFIMDAIADAEKLFATLGPKKRNCMSCGNEFTSTSIGHRMCVTCRQKSEGTEETALIA